MTIKQQQKHDQLEEELKKLRVEVTQQKSVEDYLRNQINYITKCDRAEKLKLEKLQKENEALQAKCAKLSGQRQTTKDELDAAEKRLDEERRARSLVELQLAQARSSCLNSSSQFDVKEDDCKKKAESCESEKRALSDECRKRQERVAALECELKAQNKVETRFDSLMLALKLLEDKNASLQESLSAETRFKLDLFSALGETRRQLEACHAHLDAKDRELNAFRSIFKQTLSVDAAAATAHNELVGHYLASQLNSLTQSNGGSENSSSSSSSNSSASLLNNFSK